MRVLPSLTLRTLLRPALKLCAPHGRREVSFRRCLGPLCRRRLPVVLVRLKLAETMREAVELVEQGHVRVGPEVVTDPAYLVTRGMEDYLTWVDTSKVRRHVLQYNDKLDDFDML